MKNTIRQIYFYAATLIFLIMSVVATISLLNLGLTTYIFTKADGAYAQRCDDMGTIYYYDTRPMPAEAIAGQPDPKEMTDEVKAARKAECERDVAEQKSAQRQQELVRWISMLIVAAPLFWIHFKWVQKERETEIALAKDDKKS